jgi:hypothetical protein
MWHGGKIIFSAVQFLSTLRMRGVITALPSGESAM